MSTSTDNDYGSQARDDGDDKNMISNHRDCDKRTESQSPSFTSQSPPPEGFDELHPSVTKRIGCKSSSSDSYVAFSDLEPKPDDPSKPFAILIDQIHSPRPVIILKAQSLRDAFRKEVGLYSGVRYENNGISISEPYAPLFHHLDAIEKLFETDASLRNQREDFECLQTYLNYEVQKRFESIRTRLSLGQLESCDTWALFKHGGLVVGKDNFSQIRLFCVKSVEKQTHRSLSNDEIIDWNIAAWTVEWDLTTRTFIRKRSVFYLKEFSGTRSVTSLKMFPLEYFDNGDAKSIEELCNRLKERGKLWMQLVSGAPVVRSYEGPALDLDALSSLDSEKDSPNANLDGRVIIDQQVYNDPRQKPPGPVFINEGGELDLDSPGADQDFWKHDGKTDFTDLQLSLCPSTILCFSLKMKRRYKVNVDRLRDVNWSSGAMNNLVLDMEWKSLIQQLVEAYAAREEGKVTDFISGKGNGLVIALHGPSGVGKTLTAECVAEHTRKPLYPINVGSLTEEGNITARLNTIFRRASAWGAVLLLDEADVFLEKRSFEDFKRNGIVSVFLRLLEYYEGILIMTTNRIKYIDSAFKSRIHIAFKYKDLTPRARGKIWIKFIKELKQGEESEESLLEHLEEMERWNFNGRQIRNIMTTAQLMSKNSLLANDGKLEFRHIKSIASKTREFESYFLEEEETHIERMPSGPNNPNWG